VRGFGILFQVWEARQCWVWWQCAGFRGWIEMTNFILTVCFLCYVLWWLCCVCALRSTGEWSFGLFFLHFIFHLLTTHASPGELTNMHDVDASAWSHIYVHTSNYIDGCRVASCPACSDHRASEVAYPAPRML
jgi:hypothetical protein